MTMNPDFKIAVYFTVHDVQSLSRDTQSLRRMKLFEDHLPIDHVYLETYRSGVMATDTELETVKKLFSARGVRVSGGITTTRADQKFWQLLCYSDPADVALLEAVVRLTAAHFDAFILDDFFFTDCRCVACLAAKGSKSFRQYRLELMRRISERVVATARSVNPRIRATMIASATGISLNRGFWPCWPAPRRSPCRVSFKKCTVAWVTATR